MTTDDEDDGIIKYNSGLDVSSLALKSAEPIMVAGLYARRLVDTALSLGVDLAQLAVTAGFEVHSLEKLPEEIPGASYFALMQAGAVLSNDPDFGLHVGERISPSSYPVLGYTLMSCRDLNHALQLVTRFLNIIHNLGSFEISVEDEELRVRWNQRLPAGDSSRHVTESVMVGVRVFAERLAERSLPIRSFSFVHSCREDLSELKRHFGPNLIFDAPHNEVACDAQVLDWPVVGADESLFPVLKEHAERLLILRSVQGGIVDEVRKALNTVLASGNVKLQQIAKRLAMHPRTLQRRLNDAETSFQEVLDGLRQDLAKHYLYESEVSLGEIAFLLGYHDQSSFNRAFKDWFQVSPSAFRAEKSR